MWICSHELLEHARHSTGQLEPKQTLAGLQTHEAKESVSHSLSPVQHFATPWAITHQAPVSMGFSRQEYWSGQPFPSLGDLPNPGVEPGSLVLPGGFFTVWVTRHMRKPGQNQKSYLASSQLTPDSEAINAYCCLSLRFCGYATLLWQ